MTHYKIGQQIGDFTITSFDNKKSLYTLTCKCSNTTSGDSTHVTRKIANLMSEGFTACGTCYGKYLAEYKLQKEKNAQHFTFKDVYREYVKKAKARNIRFELTLEEASTLFSSKCTYCNSVPSNSRTRDTGITIAYQGIDRIDNTKGYIQGNTTPCCKYCNFAKFDRSQDEFYKHIEVIYLNKVQRSEQSS